MAIFPGADERSPSRAQYFSWINHTNEGPTEAQTLANLAFFRWLHETYGMQLDIYAFDAGAIDGAKFYGSMTSERFRRQFPRGFGPLVEVAAQMGTRLGVWGGPDGFGDTPEDAAARTETMVALCRDHRFELFKMDAVCGHLRPEKRAAFDRMMTECRRHSPDLILLNHRLELGEAVEHSTTFLFEGAETYIDVHVSNSIPAFHNRACALERGHPPRFTRLTEDHGVCLSSCLDGWDDELVLQAFSRGLILAPEIYGNPWLLRDDEFPRLARLFKLFRRFREVLVDAVALPETRYGSLAVSRGSASLRFVTLRNPTREPVSISMRLDAELGLAPGTFEVHKMHPCCRNLGRFDFGQEVVVEVEAFRSLLVLVSAEPLGEPEVTGCDYEVLGDELVLYGLPGAAATVRSEQIQFPGVTLNLPPQRCLGTMAWGSPPSDARSLYEATCFSADNNALEVRELERSGPTQFPAVAQAREAFFGQPLFRARNLSDRCLFDDDPETGFAVSRRWGDPRVLGGGFRLDFGAAVSIDRLELVVASEYELQPLKSQEGVNAWVSADLLEWRPVSFFAHPSLVAHLDGSPIRYVAIKGTPDRVREVRGSFRGESLDRTRWRASNLFAPAGLVEAVGAWSLDFTLEELAPGSRLAVLVDGEHGVERVMAALRVGDRLVGASHRAPSYPSNTWECPVRPAAGNTAHFIDLDMSMVGLPLQVVLLHLGHRRAPWDAVDAPANGVTQVEAWLVNPDPHVQVRRDA